MDMTSSGIDFGIAKVEARERLQKEILEALSKTDFFERAFFFGGTALRIFHGLARYSEDMDFAMINEGDNLDIVIYGALVAEEMKGKGLPVEFFSKPSGWTGEIRRGYFKANAIALLRSMGYEEPRRGYPINHNEAISVKWEVDSIPMPGAESELLDMEGPYSGKVRVLTLPSLYSGKLSALLYREWRGRVKGRDYFDFLFFIDKGVAPNLPQLECEMQKRGQLNGPLTGEILKEALRERIRKADLESAKLDASIFAEDLSEIQGWTKDLFLDAIDRLVV